MGPTRGGGGAKGPTRGWTVERTKQRGIQRTNQRKMRRIKPEYQSEDGPGDQQLVKPVERRWTSHRNIQKKHQETTNGGEANDQPGNRPIREETRRPTSEPTRRKSTAKQRTVINEPRKSIKQANMQPFSTVPNSEAAPSSCP